MYLITFVALTARFFNLAAASANNSSFPDIDLTSFLRHFTNIPAGL